MTFRPSGRGAAVSPFLVMNVMNQAAEREAAGGEVLHLEVGQPGTAAPKTDLFHAVKQARAFAAGEIDDFAAVGFGNTFNQG